MIWWLHEECGQQNRSIYEVPQAFSSRYILIGLYSDLDEQALDANLNTISKFVIR